MICTLSVLLWLAAAIPGPGQKAPDFELDSIRGGRLRLSQLHAASPVALVVLRGYPGYQCPLCQRQVAEFIGKARDFEHAGTKVVFVYPGPPDRAASFVASHAFPASFEMLVDPSYEFTRLYGLRWDEPKETAYPSTFLIQPGGTIYYVKSAMLHGGRSSADEILSVLPKKKPAPAR